MQKYITLHSACAQLTVPIANDKAVEPTALLKFLGVEFDTGYMVTHLPQAKLAELRIRTQNNLILIASLTKEKPQAMINLFICLLD